MTGTLYTAPRTRAFTVSNAPMIGAKLWFYRTGTNVLAAIYRTSVLDTPHANPVQSDSQGQFPAIYLDPAAGHNYRIVLQNSAGAQQQLDDDVPASGTGTGGSGGTVGPTGDPGLSVAELRIYLRSNELPPTPTGGEFNFQTQFLTPPAGWSAVIVDGAEPLYVSTAVAAVEGSTGVDSVLAWSPPVVMAQDGSSVDIVFRRDATQPATPAPSPGTPVGWHTDVDSVPITGDKLWSSVGTRDNASLNWIWQLPIQVEGDEGPAGPPGASATMYYIKPFGTAIKNGLGQIKVEAHVLFAGNDVLLSSGSVKLYVGSTEVTTANGFAPGSTGYVGWFDNGDIAGSTIVLLKDGPSGTILDTVTLVDVIDGSTGGAGFDGVYGYIEADGPIAAVRASDGTTWTPATNTVDLDCTFVQGGVDVARVGHRITRNNTTGLLTGAPVAHGLSDLNSGRIAPFEINEGSSVMTVRFTYSHLGDTSVVAETVYTSLSGLNGTNGTPGSAGTAGPSGYSFLVTRPAIPLQAYQNGSVVSYDNANGVASLWQGDVDVSAAATFSIASSSGVTGAAILNAAAAPNPKGYYSIASLTADTGLVTLQAVHSGKTFTTTVAFSRSNVGFEIVTSLPAGFPGRIVFLNITGPGGGKLYRFHNGAWTTAVTGSDLTPGSITSSAMFDSLFAGAITTAILRVNTLEVLSANAGTISAGILQSPGGESRFDLNNARIVYNTAPGQTGGFVRVTGANFGPAPGYLDWYGPKPAGQSTDSGIIAGLADINALYFLKTDGSQFNRRTRGEFEPKMWVTFNGRSPVAVRDCYNVSSVVRNSTGVYTITFAAALANANYAVTGTADNTGDTLRVIVPAARLTTSVRIETRGNGGGPGDSDYVALVVFGSNVPGQSNVTAPSGGYGGGSWGGGNLP